MRYNDPFYFAIPRGSRRSAVSEAVEHIRSEFGITGKPEVIRIELAFALCRLVDCRAAA